MPYQAIAITTLDGRNPFLQMLLDVCSFLLATHFNEKFVPGKLILDVSSVIAAISGTLPNFFVDAFGTL